MPKLKNIKQYAFIQSFSTPDGIARFGGVLFAVSKKEARRLTRRINADFDGQLVETMCANCEAVEIFLDQYAEMLKKKKNAK